MLRLKLALLNVLRNGRRSFITLLAIQFGVISLILMGGFFASMYEGMREGVIRSQLGHIQIYKEGFNQFGSQEPEKYLIDAKVLQQVTGQIEALEQVELVTPRLNLTGLLTDGSKSLAVVVEGIDPEKEALLSSAVKLTAGEDLFEEDTDGALIGDGLFKALNLEAGASLTLMATTADGSFDARDVIATGAISTGTREVDNRFMRINLKHAQDLMYTQGVTRLVVLLKDTQDTEQVMAQLSQAFKQQGLALELRSWSDLADYYHEVVNLFDGIFSIVQIIVLAIVLLGIVNTMVMAVMERTPEIGTIRAIGGTRGEVMKLFISEAFILGLVGSVLGVIFAVLLAQGITAAEIMMPTPPGSSQTYPIRIFTDADLLWKNGMFGLLIAVVSSIYPAVKASRMVITQALRFA
ncbi:ABC transporter permease [Thalassomonas viridans]|uniref:ABC transporter permease n=1 Tax=Thalassomonas viridans TaxID=137584 RepID=A0AAF0CDE1_9GAMM|nr:FtsX-like permease family protein [Thalassomonas viridans]WDE09103.1 ABC transporter permease [Thalassomonas viridans]